MIPPLTPLTLLRAQNQVSVFHKQTLIKKITMMMVGWQELLLEEKKNCQKANPTKNCENLIRISIIIYFVTNN